MSEESTTPKSESLLHLYRGAFRTLKQTSRAKNANWYRESQDMPIQWHISLDGKEVVSKLWVGKDKAWYPGPEITIDQLREPTQEFVDQAVPPLLQTIKAKKERAVGIILHLSDSIKLAEIRTEFAEEKDFDILDDLVRIAPKESISGAEIDEGSHSWSLLPYWGESVTERNAVAFQVENSFQTFVELFTRWGEAHNIPVNVSVTSSPREALSQLPLYLPQLKGESAGTLRGCIVVVRYQTVSFLAALNQYSELCSARILPNRDTDGLPADLEWVIKNFAAAEDIENPAVCLLDLAGDGHPIGEFDFESIGFEFLEIAVEKAPGQIDGVPIEFLNGRNAPDRFADINSKLPAENKTFPALVDQWSKRNMYSLDCQDPNRFPSQKALHVLRGSRFLRVALFMAIPAVIGWCAMGVLESSRQDYWKVDNSKIFAANERMKQFQEEKKKIEYWENLMASRSEGWVVLSTILELFPEGKEIYLTDCKFSFHSLPPDRKGKHLPMRQTWSLKGFATQKGVEYLTSLSSRTPMIAKFNEIAKWSETPVYNSDEKTRTLKVLLEQKQAPMASSAIISKSKARLYRKGFELQIDREFSDKDEIALQIKNPFKEKKTDKK